MSPQLEIYAECESIKKTSLLTPFSAGTVFRFRFLSWKEMFLDSELIGTFNILTSDVKATAWATH